MQATEAVWAYENAPCRCSELPRHPQTASLIIELLKHPFRGIDIHSLLRLARPTG